MEEGNVLHFYYYLDDDDDGTSRWAKDFPKS
jgi:hypothetical protein